MFLQHSLLLLQFAFFYAGRSSCWGESLEQSDFAKQAARLWGWRISTICQRLQDILRGVRALEFVPYGRMLLLAPSLNVLPQVDSRIHI